MKRIWVMLAACLMVVSGAALAQDGYPALYAVTGVADDDVLNIRQAPNGSAPVLGQFGPHRDGIEVTGQTEDGGWLRVNTQESAGWVAARFMAREEGGDYALGRSLNCFGTEPFWSLDMIQGASATFSRMGEDPQTFPAGLLSRGQGRTDRWIVGFGQGLLVAHQRSCGDGMSDRTYALDASVVFVPGGLTLYSGCCSIQPE